MTVLALAFILLGASGGTAWQPIHLRQVPRAKQTNVRRSGRR